MYDVCIVWAQYWTNISVIQNKDGHTGNIPTKYVTHVSPMLARISYRYRF